MKNPLNDIGGQIASLDHIGQAVSSANLGQAASLSNIGQGASLDYIGRAASAAETAHLEAAYVRESLLGALSHNTINEFVERERRLNLYGIDHSVKAAARWADAAPVQHDVMHSLADTVRAQLRHTVQNLAADTLNKMTRAVFTDQHIQKIIGSAFTSQDYLHQLKEAAADFDTVYNGAAHSESLNLKFASQFNVIDDVGLLAGIRSAAAGPFVDVESFAQMAIKQMESHGMPAYASQLRDVIEHFDFDAIQSFASEQGEHLSRVLDADDESMSEEHLHEAIEQANLDTVSQRVDSALSDAISKARPAEQSGPALRPPLDIYNIRLVIFAALFQVIAEPLFTLWLQYVTAKPSPEKPKAVITPASRFENVVVVKSEVLTLRAGPSTRERALATVRKGQFLRVLKKKGLWALVCFIDPLGDGASSTGWVKLKQTQRVEDEAARLIWCELFAPARQSAEGCKEP
jgi:hypothetical protein